jgi:hypothetical protein
VEVRTKPLALQASGALVARAEGHRSFVVALAFFSAAGRFVTTQCWHPCRNPHGPTTPATSYMDDDDSATRFASVSHDGRLLVWRVPAPPSVAAGGDASAGGCVVTPLAHAQAPRIECVAAGVPGRCSPLSAVAVSPENEVAVCDRRGNVTVWRRFAD